MDAYTIFHLVLFLVQIVCLIVQTVCVQRARKYYRMAEVVCIETLRMKLTQEEN